MPCAKRVFRCFRTLERLGDRITGAAGPFFVVLAVLLITTGTVCFFDVIAPSLNFRLITLPFCILIAINLHVHYYHVCTVRPGFVDEPTPDQGQGLFWAKRKFERRNSVENGMLPGPVKMKGARVTPAETTKCRKCGQIRPERAHHCRICNRCVLKYDHHCPVWINQCVGLYNERHFVLFLMYLAISSFCYSVLGWPYLLSSLGITYDLWPYHVPEIAYAMIYILAVVICLAVGVMGGYHLWTIAHGETTVEAQDHEVYRKKAQERGEDFINSYDLGKRKNLELFFNIGDGGYPWYTLILPLRIMPYTDGRSWARRNGLTRHEGVRRGDELTDDEGDISDKD